MYYSRAENCILFLPWLAWQSLTKGQHRPNAGKKNKTCEVGLFQVPCKADHHVVYDSILAIHMAWWTGCIGRAMVCLVVATSYINPLGAKQDFCLNILDKKEDFCSNI